MMALATKMSMVTPEYRKMMDLVIQGTLESVFESLSSLWDLLYHGDPSPTGNWTVSYNKGSWGSGVMVHDSHGYGNTIYMSVKRSSAGQDTFSVAYFQGTENKSVPKRVYDDMEWDSLDMWSYHNSDEVDPRVILQEVSRNSSGRWVSENYSRLDLACSLLNVLSGIYKDLQES